VTDPRADIFAFMRGLKESPASKLEQADVDRGNALLDALGAAKAGATAQGGGFWDNVAPAVPAAPAPGGPVPHKGIADFIEGFIGTHEGGLSMDPADNGNWTGGHRGLGSLVGSKFGVTPGAVAVYRGVAASSITKADIANLTKEEAVAIGVKNYYHAPGFDKLPFNRVTLSIIDKGWGSGPGRAIKLLQRLLGLPESGALDQRTVDAYAAYIARVGEEAAAREWAAVRERFDGSLGQPRFINGWNNRTRSFLPGTRWWRAWA
jgi:lysozyme family protein